MTKISQKDSRETQEKIKSLSKEVLGSYLDFLDALPDDPPAPIQFPYGNDEPRPYGWHMK